MTEAEMKEIIEEKIIEEYERAKAALSLNVELMGWVADGTELLKRLNFATSNELEHEMNIAMVKAIEDSMDAIDRYQRSIVDQLGMNMDGEE